MKLGFISEKVGPLPVWAYIAIGAAAYFFIIRPRLASAAGSTSAPSYVQVPAAQAGGGTGTIGQQPVDLSPLSTQLAAIGTQLSNLTTLLTPSNTNVQPVPPVTGNPPSVTTIGNPATATYPAGFSFYQPSAQARLPQLTYSGSTPAPGLTPATINADLVQRWTAAGLTPQQIAERAGLTPGAHSSLTGY